jgi:uncharacterized protein (TIGR03437 family)
MTRLLLLTAILAASLSGAYSNMIAMGDGTAVFLEVQTGSVSTSWFKASLEGAEIRYERLNGRIVDIDQGGTIFAYSNYLDRRCSSPGSTCSLNFAPCTGGLTVDEPGRTIVSGHNVGGPLVRLSRNGRFAWMEEVDCARWDQPKAVPKWNGLFGLSPLTKLNGNVSPLATLRIGRTVITNSGRALLASGRLALADASGLTYLRNRHVSSEAVVDAAGTAVVYRDPDGRLHWIEATAASEDLDLGFVGFAPALTDESRQLIYLTGGGELWAYAKSNGSKRQVAVGTYLSFAVAGNQFVFAQTTNHRVVRVDLSSGATVAFSPPVPSIKSVFTSTLGLNYCQVCYGTRDDGYAVSPGMMLVLSGEDLDEPGWVATVAGHRTALSAVSRNLAYAQVPTDAPVSFDVQALQLSHPAYPMGYYRAIRIYSQQTVCLATVNADFSQEITREHPAHPGDIVHVFLTGLRGSEEMETGVPNPADRLIPLANPPVIPPGGEALFLGLAPALVGIQQLDLQIRTTKNYMFGGFNCAFSVSP